MKDSKILTDEEKERTKRQNLIEGWDQSVLKNSTIFIAGMGALGCEIAKDFALMGVGKMMLCDLDTIETSNLSRQMLFYKGDEGRYKADVAAERVKLMNPYMETEVFTYVLQKIPMEKYMECDVIIAALDNVKARIDLNKFCIKLGIPMIEGGTVGMEGHVHVIVPQSTRDINGNPIQYGNEGTIIDSLTDDLIWALDEKDELYSDYFAAEKEIEELEEKIEQIRSARITPILEELRTQAMDTFNLEKEKYLNHTPCYRCVVPVPPPPEKQIAACTLKGIPRSREHCAYRGEVQYIKKYDKKPDLSNNDQMKEVLDFTLIELQGLRDRVLDEQIPPEQKDTITEEELTELRANIYETFPNYELFDMENVLGQKIPAIQSVSSIISSLESQEALKLIFLMNGTKVGEIINPPYMNYNGIYGQFDMVPVMRNEECVACGSGLGQESVQVAIAEDSTVGDLFNALNDLKIPITMQNWMITNPLTKAFIYNPMFEKGKTQDEKLSEFEVKNMDELTFTVFGSLKNELEIKQYNVIISKY